jgi:uncharacterized protein DUF4192
MKELNGGPRLRISSRQDLVELAPYLLGFHPVESVVVLVLSADERSVVLAARIDLAHAAEPQVRDELTLMLRRSGGTQAVLLVYGPRLGVPPTPEEAELGELPYAELVEALIEVVEQADVRFFGGGYIAGDRWWSYRPCADRGCCPPHGMRIEGEDSQVAAAATFLGLTALRDRTALEETLAPIDDPGIREALGVAKQELLDAGRARDVDGWCAGVGVQLRSVLDRVTGGDSPWLPDRVAARLVLGLAEQRIRDIAWLWLEIDPDTRWLGAERLWRQLIRRAPEEYRLVPLALFAWACWRGGDGIRARIGVERALTLDPTYQMALLLRAALEQGVDPGDIATLLSGLDGEASGKARTG